jgi:multicomponent Na+:H+ antiporter subunit G
MIEQIRIAAIVALVGAGLFFTFVSTVGVLRLPDIYSRSHTASQADTLGAGFALAAVALSLGVNTTASKTVLLLFFIFITNPTAAHAISRAADEEGIEPWTTDDDRTDVDLAKEAGVQTDGGHNSDAGDTGQPTDSKHHESAETRGDSR